MDINQVMNESGVTPEDRQYWETSNITENFIAYINNRREDMVNRMVTSKNVEEMWRCQGQIQELQNVLSIIKNIGGRSNE